MGIDTKSYDVFHLSPKNGGDADSSKCISPPFSTVFEAISKILQQNSVGNVVN